MTLSNKRHEAVKEAWANGNGVAGEVNVSKSHGEHGMTEDYVAAGAHAAVSQAFRELLDPANMAALTSLVVEQAANVAQQAITLQGRAASRISAEEAFTGSYDAVERKYDAWWKSMPPSYVTIFGAACAFLGMLLLGLTLALWRFALFGLS